MYGTYRGLGCSLRIWDRVRGEAKSREVEASTDQRPTTHPSRIVNRPSRTCLFQSLSIKQLTLDSEFKVVNTLVINHRWLWELEMSLRVPRRILCPFRRFSREKQRKGSRGHVQCHKK